MEKKNIWTENIVTYYHQPKPQSPQHNNSIKQAIFTPDGLILFVIVADVLLVYNAENAQMISRPVKICTLLSSAKQKINALAINKQGKMLATGSADKTCVLYKFNLQGQKKLQPQLKFSQGDSINCLSFNPLTQQVLIINKLFSGSNCDFAVFTVGESNIPKQKYPQKITCCAWSSDGQSLAFGTANGTVSFKQRNLDERGEVKRKSPCWCLQWTPITSDHQQSYLLAGFCDQVLVYYTQNGQQKSAEKRIGFDATCISFHHSSEYFLLSGTNKKLTMWSRDLGYLADICENNSWSWSSKIKPKSTDIIMSTDDGVLSLFQISKMSISDFYQDLYAVRENLTDVVVQNVSINQKVIIKCKQLVKKISIYKDKIIVLQRQRVLIYICTEQGFKFKPFKKIGKKIDCDFMGLTSHNVVFSKNKKIQCYSFYGELERQWILSATITCMRIIGGPQGRQSFLVGQKNGNIQQIFVDNSFPINIWNQNCQIVMCDLNQTKKKLALLDSNKNLLIVDLISHIVVNQQMGIDSFSWNAYLEDTIAFSGNGVLGIRTGVLPQITQKMQAKIASFMGFKLYVFKEHGLTCLDVSHSPTIFKLIERKQFKQAYKIAAIGATQTDLRTLGIEALQFGNYEIAMKCFQKIKDLPFINLTQKYQKISKEGGVNNDHLKAQILTYEGKYNEAVAIYKRVNSPQKAVQLYIQLKQWEQAIKHLPKSGDKRFMERLIHQQSQWLLQNGEWRKAGGLYMSIKEYKKAIDIFIQQDHLEGLIQVCRLIDVSDNSQNLHQIARYFKKNKHNNYAKQAYMKLGDLKSLLMMYIQLQNWEQAFMLAKQNREFLQLVKFPYANWLIKNDQHQKALSAFQSLGRSDITSKMLKSLAANSIEQKKFQQAAKYHYLMSKQQIRKVNSFKNPQKQDKESIEKFNQLINISEAYCAYAKISQFVQSPFFAASNSNLVAVMNAARFIISKIHSSPNSKYRGINLNYVYYSLSKVAQQLQAFKTTRICLEKISNFKIPSNWVQQVDLTNLLVRSKPFSDKEQLLPLCYRCLTLNPIISEKDSCFSCKHPFVVGFGVFEVLPLVQFKVDSRLTHAQVMELLNQQKKDQPVKKKKIKASDGWTDSKGVSVKNLNFRGLTNPQLQETLFFNRLCETIQAQQTSLDYIPIMLDEQLLRSLSLDQVYFLDMKKLNMSKEICYYKNMIPDVLIKSCNECYKFFLLVIYHNKDDYQLQYIQTGKCPFCKATDKRWNKKEAFDI